MNSKIGCSGEKMAKKKSTNRTIRKLQNYLILNRYLLSFFKFRSIENVRNLLLEVPEGFSSNNRFNFTDVLLPKCNSLELKQQLEKYDENIQFYQNKINEKHRKIRKIKEIVKSSRATGDQISRDLFQKYSVSLQNQLIRATEHLRNLQRERMKDTVTVANGFVYD